MWQNKKAEKEMERQRKKDEEKKSAVSLRDVELRQVNALLEGERLRVKEVRFCRACFLD
jgi:hypothetical protein